MQTTLLGLAIALILALIAALVGPFFIDWNQFRTQFEAEASRVLGAPVRVDGALDARLLPTPTLRLRSVVVGGANDPGRLRADRLNVEFSLGSLMRGDWRADELTINGFALDLGLDGQGRLDWPASGLANLAGLTIDRLNLTGRIALHDAASRSTVELSDIAFSGELRPQAGSLRGDGNFLVAGTRYPFRLSAGKPTDGEGTRLHLALEPSGFSLDLDGLLSFAARAPRFDGTLMVATPAKAGAEDRTPWRVSTKIKADPAGAQLEQLEGGYGPDDRSLKLTGTADVRFGASPRLHATLAAKQIDADRLFAAGNGGSSEPLAIIGQLRGLGASLPHPGLPTRIEISADQIMLGSRPVQNLAADLRSDKQAWSVNRLEFRAPGGAQLTLSDVAAVPDKPDRFKGAVALDAADPELLAAWLQGRSNVTGRVVKPLRARGTLSVDSDSVVIDALNAEFDGGSLRGRIASSAATTDHGSRLDATLKADRLDFDLAGGILRALAGPQAALPDETRLDLEIVRAEAFGQTLQPFALRLASGPKSVTLEQLNIGAGGLALTGAGQLDRSSATGKLTLSANAESLGAITKVVGPLAPAVAARLDAMGPAAGPARVTLAFELNGIGAQAGRVNARAVAEIAAPQLKGDASFTAKPLIADISGFNFEALMRGEISAETRLSSDRARALLALLGLDRAIASDDGAVLEASASGAWQAPLRLKLRLAGTDLDADAEGTAEPWAVPAKATLNLKAQRLNIAPLLQATGREGKVTGISFATRLDFSGNKLTFNDIDGSIAGSRLRGRLGVTLGDEIAVDGEAGADLVELGPAFAAALGAAGRDTSQPLSRGLLGGWRGQVAFQALRGVLPGGSELQPVSGVIRSDGRSLTLESKGKLGGGEVTADIVARLSDNGVALNARARMSGVDGATLRYRGLTLPGGRASMQMVLDSAGRSPAALAGAVSGGGTLTLEAARIAGLDSRAFDAAIRAGDGGQPIDDARLEKIVAPVLAAGSMSVAVAQFPFSVKDGRLRVAATTLESQGAKAVVSGGYDIPADQADIRASLTSTQIAPGALRPDIQIFAVGTPDGLNRSIDVAALSSWLAVRRIDRETQKLELMERQFPPAKQPVSVPPPSAPAATPAQPAETPAPQSIPDLLQQPDQPAANVPLPAPRMTAPKPATAHPSRAPRERETIAPLPPPIEVRPAPGDSRAPKLRPPLVLTPPGSPRAAF